MKWHILLIVLLGALLLPTVVGAQPREDALVIPAGQSLDGNVATVARDIRVEGAVAGDVTTWSGDIDISGTVGGDVVSYSGTVTIRSTAQISGHVLASGGVLRMEEGALVAGQAIRGAGGAGALANLLDLFAPADGSSDLVVGRILFAVVLGIFLLALSLLCTAFWPQRSAAASRTLLRFRGRALALGLLTTLLLALALPPLIALLAATLIGLPLVILVLVCAQVAYIFGLATLARVAGLRGGTIGGPERATVIVAGGLALLVALVTALAPLWGLALFYLLASPGLGAAILSRGGLFAPAMPGAGATLSRQ